MELLGTVVVAEILVSGARSDNLNARLLVVGLDGLASRVDKLDLVKAGVVDGQVASGVLDLGVGLVLVADLGALIDEVAVAHHSTGRAVGGSVAGNGSLAEQGVISALHQLGGLSAGQSAVVLEVLAVLSQISDGVQGAQLLALGGVLLDAVDLDGDVLAVAQY